MPANREQLLALLQQARTQNPNMTKSELAALLRTQLASGTAGGDSQLQPDVDHTDTSDSVSEDHLLQQAAAEPEMQESSEKTVPADDGVPASPQSDRKPLLSRRSIGITLFLAACVSCVAAGVYIFSIFLPSQPTYESTLADAISLANTPPAETGELTRFGKRFANDSSYYQDKYKNKVLEMVGMVEVVERQADGYLDVTLLLADPKKQPFRARFRFMREQGEAVALASGTMAVLKGRYVGYHDGVMRFFPATIVYNDAQP